MKKNTLLIIISLVFSIQIYAQQSKSGPKRPIGVTKGIIQNNKRNATIINGVPAYLWHRGCGPTALGMLIGYYDTHGLPDLIDGDASNQTINVNDAIANDEHYNDYSLPLDNFPNLKQDKSDLGDAHLPNCIADFMETSWSSKSNYWGWSWSNKIDDAFRGFVKMKNNEYETFETYEFFSTQTSWNIFTKEINNNRPVILLVDTDGDGDTDHFVTGIGYDDSNNTYAIYDTWDRNIHWYKWRKMSTNYSWGIYGFNILKFRFDISANSSPTIGGTISGLGTYDYNQTANLIATATEGCHFINWTENGIEVSTNPIYNFKVTENRILVANFDFATSIVDLKKNANINIYPNPMSDRIHIKVKNNNTMFEYEIMNTVGQIISKGNFIKDITVRTNNFAPGIYLIRLKNGGKLYLKKMLKK